MFSGLLFLFYKNSQTINTLLLIAALFTGFTVASAQFDGGDGSESNPYRISSVEQLQQIADHTEAHFVQTSDIDARATIDWNDGAGFEPIRFFTGTFDGYGYEIINLTIDREDLRGTGLFGTVNDGTLKNIVLKDIAIVGGVNTGGLVGQNSGEILNSQVSGTVSGERIVGGLVGVNEDEGMILYSFASVETSGDISVVGGLIGYNSGIVQDAYALGQIDGNENHVGGLVGWHEGDLKRTYASGEVIGDGGTVGGLVGRSDDGVFKDNVWNTELTGRNFAIGGSGISDGAHGLTTFEMQRATEFENWDFDNIWKIESGDERSYPYLRNNEQSPAPGFAQLAGFGNVAPGITESVTIEISNPTDDELILNGYEVISGSSLRWTGGSPENIIFEHDFEYTIPAQGVHQFEISWTPELHEVDINAVIRLNHTNPYLDKNHYWITLEGEVDLSDVEGDIVIRKPLHNERSLTGKLISFNAELKDDSIPETDVCWSSGVDGFLGCGSELSAELLSIGQHEIVAEASGEADTVSIRVFADLWEIYQSKPADSEIERILNDFHIEFVDGDGDDQEWEPYGFEFDLTSTDPSRMVIIALLEVLRHQRFEEQPTFTGNYETVYDWARSVVHTIRLHLDCRPASGGGGRANLPRRISHWGPIHGDPDCGEPMVGDHIQDVSYYRGSLMLFVHEVRHSEPDDPGHINCNGRSGDENLEDGSGYAYAAKYNMWTYKYSLYDPPLIRYGTPGRDARSSSISQLGAICGDGEPIHSDPRVQEIVDELYYNDTPALYVETEEILDFGTVEIGDSHSKQITIRNTGDDNLEGEVTLTDGEEYFSFENDNLNFDVQRGQPFQVTVTFSPEEADTVTGTIGITHNAHNYESPFEIALTGIGDDVTVVEEQNDLPDEFALKQNYPNPFNPLTRIRYDISEPVHVELNVYNYLGQKVESLVNEEQPAGRYEVIFDARHIASGLYIYRLQTGDHVITRTMIFIK